MARPTVPPKGTAPDGPRTPTHRATQPVWGPTAPGSRSTRSGASARYRRFRRTPKMERWISRPAGVFMKRRAILPTWIRSWVSTPLLGAGDRRAGFVRSDRNRRRLPLGGRFPSQGPARERREPERELHQWHCGQSRQRRQGPCPWHASPERRADGRQRRVPIAAESGGNHLCPLSFAIKEGLPGGPPPPRMAECRRTPLLFLPQ